MDQLLSISKIFSERIIKIPDYQRGYAWGQKEIEDFWGDLCRLEKDKNHYVGVLTLQPVVKKQYKNWIDDLWIIEAKKYTPFYVVDGQQRLTTSIILIFSILKTMKERNIAKLNYTSQDEISRKYIYEYQDENKSRTYIFGYEYDNPSYEFLITKIFEENIVIDNKSVETIYTNNLDFAKRFFIKKFKDMSTEELENFYTKITQHFLFNMYIISSDIDVFVTFETMNNRGKRLSNLELLKNRLIYLSTLVKCNDSDKARLRRDVNSCWKNIYHILGKCKDRKLMDDEFLVTHFMVYFCKNIDEIEKQNNIIYDEFGDWQSNYLLNSYFVVSKIADNQLTTENCFDYIESINKCVQLWGEIKDPSTSNLNEELKEYIDRINFFSISRPRFYRHRFFLNFSYLNVF